MIQESIQNHTFHSVVMSLVSFTPDGFSASLCLYEIHILEHRLIVCEKSFSWASLFPHVIFQCFPGHRLLCDPEPVLLVLLFVWLTSWPFTPPLPLCCTSGKGPAVCFADGLHSHPLRPPRKVTTAVRPPTPSLLATHSTPEASIAAFNKTSFRACR